MRLLFRRSGFLYSKWSAILRCKQQSCISTTQSTEEYRTTTGDGKSSVLERLNLKPAEVEGFLLRHLARKLEEPTFESQSLQSKGCAATEAVAVASTEPDGSEIVGSRDDTRFHRRLSNRFTTPCDQEKYNGTTEAPFDTIQRDVQLCLRGAREALSALHSCLTEHQTDEHYSKPIPRRLVVLVLYSHTRHNAAVGHHMKCIRDTVQMMLCERHHDVLGVVNAAVGVRWRDLEVANSCQSEALIEGVDKGSVQQDGSLWYPNAGVYTFNALLQCLCRVDMECHSDRESGSPFGLHRKILIISEGWSHVRTATELHRDQQAQQHDVELQNDTVSIEPLPFVLGSTHSEAELLQLSRYTACRALA